MRVRMLLGSLLLLSSTVYAGIELGSVVIYDNGQVEKLLESNSQWSVWQDARKRVYKRSNLPFLPVLEYRRFRAEESGYNHTLITGSPEQLMPYGELEMARFSVLRNDVRKGKSKKYWRCNYVGVSEFKYRKQILPTQKYDCTRYSPGRYFEERFRERIEIEYATDLGIPVRQTKTNRQGGHKKVKMVRILSPEKATAKRISRIVYRERSK